MVHETNIRSHLNRAVVATIGERRVTGQFQNVDGNTQFVADSGQRYGLNDVSEFESADGRAGKSSESADQAGLVIAAANPGQELWDRTHPSIAGPVAEAVRSTAEGLWQQIDEARGTPWAGLTNLMLWSTAAAYDAVSTAVQGSDPQLQGMSFFGQLTYLGGVGARERIDLSIGLEELAPEILSAPQRVQEALAFLLAAGFPLRSALDVAETRFGERSSVVDQRSWSEMAQDLAHASGMKFPSDSTCQAIAIALAAVESLPFIVVDGALRTQQAEALARLTRILEKEGIVPENARAVAEAVRRKGSVLLPSFTDLWSEILRVLNAPDEPPRLRSSLKSVEAFHFHRGLRICVALITPARRTA